MNDLSRTDNQKELKSFFEMLADERNLSIIWVLSNATKPFSIDDIKREASLSNMDIATLLQTMQKSAVLVATNVGNAACYSLTPKFRKFLDSARDVVQEPTSKLYDILNYGIRWPLILFLNSTENISVKALAQRFSVTAEMMSSTLRVLRDCGIVDNIKDGSRCDYYVTPAFKLAITRAALVASDSTPTIKEVLDEFSDLELSASGQSPDTTDGSWATNIATEKNPNAERRKRT